MHTHTKKRNQCLLVCYERNPLDPLDVRSAAPVSLWCCFFIQPPKTICQHRLQSIVVGGGIRRRGGQGKPLLHDMNSITRRAEPGEQRKCPVLRKVKQL